MRQPSAASFNLPDAITDTSNIRRRLAFILMVVSGFAGLGYQIVWTQQASLWLGHEAAAVLAVITAFFGGLSVGGWMLGPRIDRSARPALWYGCCEAVIGLWSLVLVFLMTPICEQILAFTGVKASPLWQWTLAFGSTFLLLLPATAAMGATLPAMERVLASIQQRGGNLAALYAGNTFGAVVGVLGTAFWLVPAFGLIHTALVCVAGNLVCAGLALRMFPAVGRDVIKPVRSTADNILFLLLATGLLGIGYEVLVVRVLSQLTENTVYTFALLLAVYLVGTALGAGAYHKWWSAVEDKTQFRNRLLNLLAAACLLGSISLAGAEIIKAELLAQLTPGMTTALFAEAALAVMAFLLPTLIMGALFSHLGTHARTAGVSFGHALGVNTLGAAAAPIAFGVLLLPALGTQYSLLLVAAGYLALTLRRAWPTPTFWLTAMATVAMGIWAPPLRFVQVPPGGKVVSYQEGVMAAVSIVQDADGVARLYINNRQQEGSSATLFADARQALLPLLLHPAPRRALFLGIGTGVTSSSAAQDPALDVDAVELLPEVIDASAYFRRAFDETESRQRLHLITADARRFVRASHEQYDLIVSDNFHPARSGSGALYTVEHFSAVRDRLAEGGLFCQWLPLHQLDLDTLRSIVRAFVTAFPHGWALLATNSLDTPVVGLVAHANAEHFDVNGLRKRLADAPASLKPAEFGVPDDLALLGSFIAGPRALASFAADAALNTDDHPVVAYQAPRITYMPDSLPRDRLISLLQAVNISPQELVGTGDPALQESDWQKRLAAYWIARNNYLDAGRSIVPTADVQHMLAQVRAPLLAVLHTSPDFQPAYDPLLRMAMALGRSDVAEARALLTELQKLQPLRPEAAQALLTLSEGGL